MDRLKSHIYAWSVVVGLLLVGQDASSNVCGVMSQWAKAKQFSEAPVLTGEVVVGERIGIGGLRSKVYAADYGGEAGSFALKVWHWRRSYDAVKKMAYHYKRVHLVIGEHATEPIGIVRLADGSYGLLMERLPDGARVLATENVKAQTIADLDKVESQLIAAKLQIDELQITALPNGRLKLFDLDELKSWRPWDPMGWRGSKRAFRRDVRNKRERLQELLAPPL